MILVDSSVWIASIRGSDSSAAEKLASAIRTGTVIVGDLVLLEVLQGAHNDGHATLLERSLRMHPVIGLCDETIAIRAAANYRHLRQRGITVRKTVDTIIATFCIANGHSLLHQDRDFLPFVEHLGLQVV